MMTIFDRAITKEDMDNLASYMDDGIRETLHTELSPCTPEEFIYAYLEKDPDFWDILVDEFEFKAYGYCIIDDCTTKHASMFDKCFKTKEEALDEAESEWRTMTEHDKNNCDAYYVGACRFEEID